MNHGVNNSQRRLCSTRSRFNFKGLLDIGLPRQGQQNEFEGFRLGSVADLFERRHCQLCCLISRGITCYWPSAPRTEILKMNVNNENDFRYLHVHSDIGPVFPVESADPWKSAFQLKKRRKTTVALDILRTCGASNTKCMTSRHMLPDLDIAVLRTWILRCETEHHQYCGQASSAGEYLPDEFILIDVNARCIVQAPGNPRFVALSYVWGNPKDQFRTSRKHLRARTCSTGEPKVLLLLPDQLAEVVENAILLVQGLGEMYLWVDALCIIHDDVSHRTTQLNAMDSIYGCSLLTIIAASGFSFNNHLPGYSKIPRSLQSISGNVASSEFVVRLPPEHATIDGLSRSPWIHRAWTFQEGLLSKRRLIFTNQEVFFICREDLWVESRQDPPVDQKYLIVPWSTASHEDGDGSWLRALFNNRSLQSPVWLWNHYKTLVEGYLSRDITHTSDSLNAFRGLERRMQSCIGIKFFWGLPEGEDFHRALLWLISDPQVSSPVKDGFPSWSWAGWFKGPHYVRMPGMAEETTVDEPPHVEGIAKFWKETEDGEREEIDTTTQMADLYKQARTPPPPYRSYMLVESMLADFEVTQVDANGDAHLFSEGKDLGPVKFQRISRRDFNRKMRNKSLQFIAVSGNCMWLAERDYQGFQFNMHRTTVAKKEKKDYGSLNIGSRLIEDRNWVMINAMVLEWQGETARCMAMCQIKDETWNAARLQRKVVKLA